MPLELTSFISGHPDWEALLAAAPYYIKTKRTEDFVLLKYDQLNSDFALPLVRECRGEWRVSSNGEIDARNAVINSALLTGGELHNLYELFYRGVGGDRCQHTGA
jgi:hypothetical protein